MPPPGFRGRHYKGPASLGTLTIWTCPGCEKKNEGRTPEQGCAHCGAGDPTKGSAGTAPAIEEAAATPPRAAARTASVDRAAETTVAPTPPSRAQSATVGQAGTRVLRLIEYLIAPGQDAKEVLRRSLVGTVDFPWGSITGTIVDSCDSNQEDRLQLARRQPGVWLGNSLAVEQQGRLAAPERPLSTREMIEMVNRVPATHQVAPQRRNQMVASEKAPEYTREHDKIAAALFDVVGRLGAHTLALALQNVAEELATNPDPLHFWEAEYCVGIAKALLDRIPQEWLDQQEPPPAPEVSNG